MGHVKRVGDCSALFAAGAASMYLLRQFMQYDFTEKAEGFMEKIKFFFSDDMRKNYNFYLMLIALLLLSFIVSTAFHKLPYIPLALSALPVIQVVMMADLGRLYERPMVYTVLSILHFAGCLYECIRRDREDTGRRSAIGTDLLALVIFGFLALTLYLARNPETIDGKQISALELAVHNATAYDTPILWAFKYGIVAFPLLVAVRLIHSDLYFIDAILSVVPLVTAFIYWGNVEKSLLAPAITCLCALYAAARITTMLCCKARIKEKKTKTEETEAQR